MLSVRTRRTYAADWALFTDWCAATDTTPLPADPRIVVDFLTGCAAAAATQRCRVAAIDHHHSGAGYERPGESVAVRAALGRPTGEPFQPTDRDRDAVEAALRGLPRTAGPPACSAAATAACWCSPNSRGCRIDTSPPLPPETSI